MIILISGSTHAGKTNLAQKLLERYHYPYLSIDHLKMGLIRSHNTTLTPYDDDELVPYLWNIVREIVKTAIENNQNLIIEGCYIPFDWHNDFDDEYLKHIKYFCLVMTKEYIETHFSDVLKFASVIEKRGDDDLSAEYLIDENQKNLSMCQKYGHTYILIDKEYSIDDIVTKVMSITMTKGIIVFGGNGSGKTTIGRELARALNYKHIDIEDYYFNDAEIPYSAPRSREECIALMLADIKKYGSFVLSSVRGDLGEKINSMYECAVYLSAPLEIRLDRVKKRAFEKFGNRVLEGGDMYEQEQRFFDFVASRSLADIEKWAETLKCPVIKIDAEKPISENVEYILSQYQKIANKGKVYLIK